MSQGQPPPGGPPPGPPGGTYKRPGAPGHGAALPAPPGSAVPLGAVPGSARLLFGTADAAGLTDDGPHRIAAPRTVIGDHRASGPGIAVPSDAEIRKPTGTERGYGEPPADRGEAHQGRGADGRVDGGREAQGPGSPENAVAACRRCEHTLITDVPVTVAGDDMTLAETAELTSTLRDETRVEVQ